MNTKIEIEKIKLQKCLKYKDYATAIYISMYLSKINPNFNLLTAILLYENGEYSRSIETIKKDYLYADELTRLYYRALNHKALKQYQDAINCLNIIVANNATIQNSTDPLIDQYLCFPEDSEYYNLLLGELLILRGKSYLGISKYRKSFFKEPLLGSCYALYNENIFIEMINEHKEDIIMNFYQDLFKFNLQSSDIEYIPKNMDEVHKIDPIFAEYLSQASGYGCYFLSKIASNFCKYTMSGVGNEIFNVLRKENNCYIEDLDVYSTSLWVKKNINLLGLLSRQLIETHPDNHITWAVLGNYYSLDGNTTDSILCFMKSLSKLETAYTYNLLGLEKLVRKQCIEAQTYFKSSLSMLENNDRAYFGLGMSNNEIQKRNQTEQYYTKAIEINPRNLNMRAMLIKFSLEHQSDEITFQRIKEFLGFDCDNYISLANYIKNKIGTFNEVEELVILEFSELLVRGKNRELAKEILGSVNCRTKTYYSKRIIIETSI